MGNEIKAKGFSASDYFPIPDNQEFGGGDFTMSYWQNIVVTRDSKKLTLYVDGIKRSSISWWFSFQYKANWLFWGSLQVMALYLAAII